MKDPRNKKTKARDKWMASIEGKDCCNPAILFSPHNVGFLRHRIEHAFCSGWDAAEKARKQ